jgi:hypothetical protein
LTIIVSDAFTKNIKNEYNDTSRIVIDDSRVMLRIVASLTGDSRGVIYDHNMIIKQVNGFSLGIFNSPRTDSGNAYDDVTMNADNNKNFILVFLNEGFHF